ncbi:MAG: class I SAM-dependent methyltransferase [Bacteroidota bacterium]
MNPERKELWLNLGCGSVIHPDFVNIDFASSLEGVISHNLLEGIPFESESADLVYHSHLLEHFTEEQGLAFLHECYRVLKPGGVIRIAVPDLETIAREYLKWMEAADNGDEVAAQNYDWIMLEFFDQVVRTESGGRMKDYLAKEHLPNEQYLLSRWGGEFTGLRKALLAARKSDHGAQSGEGKVETGRRKGSVRAALGKLLFSGEKEYRPSDSELIREAEFRKKGEIHRWMYDRYSLARILVSAGFTGPVKMEAGHSQIPGWSSFGLDTRPDGSVRKPDSLFMEARK